jgi:tRNA-binding EMAP/Myf-like protein
MVAKVLRVDEVTPHPNADRLSIVLVGHGWETHQCVSAKLPDGTPRYKVGDRVVHVAVGSRVPESLLRKGFWDEEKGKGLLGGDDGNVVHPFKIRGVTSSGILYTVDEFDGFDEGDHFSLAHEFPGRTFEDGEDVSELLGVES